jgi:cytochrome c-type biogenesis protein CcmH
MTLRRRLVAPLVSVLLALASLSAAAPTHAASTHHGSVSFTQAQQEFNCTICHEPLNEAKSAEAYQENALLRTLIAHGDTMAQIRHTMVLNYGEAVLANPPKRGFAVLIVIVPVAVILLGLVILVYTWRRRAAAQEREPPMAAPAISDADQQRLAADLANRD